MTTIMKVWAHAASAVLLLLALAIWPNSGQADQKTDKLQPVGYVENLMMLNHDLRLKAKVDTGAKTSSIHAPDFEVFKRDGKKYVQFDLKTEKGRKVTFKARLKRFVRIRRAGVGLQRRPVVLLSVCLGGRSEKEEFTLTDRAGMNYKAIIGRSFLEDRFLVNSGEAFLASKMCPDKG